MPESSKNEPHALCAWETYVKPSKFKKLFIVAHSFGGKCVAAIHKAHQKDFQNRVSKAVFTDCKVLIEKQSLTSQQRDWMWSNCLHLVKSSLPLGTIVDNNKHGQGLCPSKSAGHEKHEYVTGTAHSSICKFLGI